MRMTKLGALLGAALGVLAAATAVSAQDAANYPTKPIRVIVPFAAGGGNDIFARLVGNKLSEILGQPVINENKPGAGGRIAAEYVMNQPKDGYTLFIGASGVMSIAAAAYPNLTYHPTKTFIPLTMIANFPLILVVPPELPIKNVKELVEYAKKNPDKSNYASTSPAFTTASELLKLRSGMPGQMIPYKSSNEMMLSVAGGNSLFSIADGPPTVPLVQGNKIRALAVTGSERSSELPDVPSMAEAGYPDVNVGLWSGVFVSVHTPPAIASKLETALRRVLADEGVRSKLKAMAVNPVGNSSEDFRKIVDADIIKFGEVVKAANLHFEQ
jgi:tripartite-type tricarboxylate transporter receptor subunit TctC